MKKIAIITASVIALAVLLSVAASAAVVPLPMTPSTSEWRCPSPITGTEERQPEATFSLCSASM